MSSLWHDSLTCVLTALLPWVVSYPSKKKIIHLPDTQVVTENVGIALLYMSSLDVTRAYVYTHGCVCAFPIPIERKTLTQLISFVKIKFQHLSTAWYSASYKAFKKLTAWLSAFCYSKYSPFLWLSQTGITPQPTIVLSQIAYKSSIQKTLPIR